MQSLTLQRAQTKNNSPKKKPPHLLLLSEKNATHLHCNFVKKKNKNISSCKKKISNTDLNKKVWNGFLKMAREVTAFFLRWRPIRGSAECWLVDIESKIALSAATELRTLKVESRQTQSIVCFWSFNGTEDCVRVKCVHLNNGWN